MVTFERLKILVGQEILRRDRAKVIGIVVEQRLAIRVGLLKRLEKENGVGKGEEG